MRTLARRLGLRITLLLLAGGLAAQARTAEIDLTRHLDTYGSAPHEATVHTASFPAAAGPARLIIIPRDAATGVNIRLNGSPVLGNGAAPVAPNEIIDVTLDTRNSIEVEVPAAAAPVSIRIKQTAEVELHVQSRIHFNTNVSDFAVSREFYGGLGFATMSGFPDTNTLEMAQAIGIETPTTYDGAQGEAAGGYLLHGELIGVGGFRGGVIDLIEFSIPKDDAPPYAHLNHLGMTHAAMHTTDIHADYRYMTAQGVEFLSAPAERVDGSWFAVFRDPDGTYYELIEVEGENDPDAVTQIVGLGHVNVNVSDFERSLAWYQMLGYRTMAALPATESLEVAKAMGFDAPFEIRGAMLAHPSDASTLELVQWLAPTDPERAYPLPVNHIGIHRMAFLTSDIEADVATLKAQGVRFVSEITPCCSGADSWGSIVAFYDPDGTIVELVEQPLMGTMLRIMRWFANVFS